MRNKSIKIKQMFAVLVVTSCLFLVSFGQEQKKIIETVVVSNVQVPVRVFDGKKPVDGLTKEDFKIFINGKEGVINGFYQVRKKLETVTGTQSDPVRQKESTGTQDTAPRLFVLLFNLYDYHQDLNSIIDTLFKDVLRPGDRLTIISNSYFYPEWEITDLAETRKTVDEILKKEIGKIRTTMLQFQNQLRDITQRVKTRLDQEQDFPDYPVTLFRDFFQDYRILLIEMKSRYLALPTEQYIKIARYLRGHQMDKYVLNFFQIGRLPLLSDMGDIMKALDFFSSDGGDIARDLKTMVMDYLSEQRPILDRISQDVAKIFLNSGATFHTMMLKPINLSFESDYAYRAIATDTEIMLKKLSRTTGGTSFTSNKMTTFVKKISTYEDIVYMLTYNPGKTRKNAKLEIKLANKSYRLSYDNQKRLKKFQAIKNKVDRADTLEIAGIQCTQTQMFLKLKNMTLVQQSGKDFGAVKIRVKIKERNRVINSFTKTFKGVKENGVAPVELPELPEGDYTIVVEVKDLFAFNSKFIGDAVNFVKETGTD